MVKTSENPEIIGQVLRWLVQPSILLIKFDFEQASSQHYCPCTQKMNVRQFSNAAILINLLFAA